eukprot:5156103-Amphidinium_carterae.1
MMMMMTMTMTMTMMMMMMTMMKDFCTCSMTATACEKYSFVLPASKFDEDRSWPKFAIPVCHTHVALFVAMTDMNEVE